MYKLIFILPILFITIECASYYSRYDTTGYPSSTISNSNNNFPYKSVSYAGDIASFPESTRYPNYSPAYGYGSSPGYNSYSPGYTSYSSTRYPGSYSSSYSTNSYNSLYNGGSFGSSNLNNNQGLNSYGSTYGTGSSFGSGSMYGSGSRSNYGSGSTYGTGSYGTGSGSYGSGYASSYGNYGSGSTGGYRGYNSYDAPYGGLGACENRSPQTGIHVENLMGFWYGVEYIQHLGADSHFDYMWTCIVIHLSEPRDPPSTENQLFHVQHINAKFRQDYRHLRLLWDEAGHTTEYALYFRNDTAGYWHVYDGQNGTMTNLPGYQQFGGTVQVLKAVNDHLVLNFCQEGTNFRSPQLYSVLFSRNPGELNRWEVDSVHSLLQNKRLSTASRRMVCGNSSATKTMYSLMTSVLMCLFAFFVKS